MVLHRQLPGTNRQEERSVSDCGSKNSGEEFSAAMENNFWLALKSSGISSNVSGG